VVLDELPDALSSIVQYGVTHLQSSDTHSRLIALPTDSHHGGRGMSARAAVGLVIAVLVLLFGIGSLIRYMRMEFLISISEKNNTERANNERWGLLRRFAIGGSRNDENCDRTQMSSICNSSSRTGRRSEGRSGGSPKKYRSARSTAPAKPPKQVDIQHYYYNNKIDWDSPYIVEPDDDEDDDMEGERLCSNNGAEEAGVVDPLASFGVDVF